MDQQTAQFPPAAPIPAAPAAPIAPTAPTAPTKRLLGMSPAAVVLIGVAAGLTGCVGTSALALSGDLVSHFRGAVTSRPKITITACDHRVGPNNPLNEVVVRFRLKNTSFRSRSYLTSIRIRSASGTLLGSTDEYSEAEPGQTIDERTSVYLGGRTVRAVRCEAVGRILD